MGSVPSGFDAVDDAIRAGAGVAVSFLERLIGARSTVGEEAPAQRIVADELARLGFDVAVVPIPPETAAQPGAGVAQAPYPGRANVWGRLGAGGSPSLLLNGHVDVVPAEPAVWRDDPFAAVTSGGWMTGRGAGDMKGGFAMGLLAVAALRRAMPGAISGELGFLSVIEEECTGNGTLAACQAGVLGDAVVILEPTDLDLLLGGVGVLWAEIEIAGIAAHAASADRAQNPVASIPAILAALETFEDEVNDLADPAFGDIARPYNVSVGTVTAGDWASSVPGRARLRVRVGFPRAWSPDEALNRLSAAVSTAGKADPWLAARPPAISPVGFRAEGHLLPADHWLAEAMAAAHQAATGVQPHRAPVGATTDARFYLNQFAVPALAYGPRARNIHAVDEAVELASIVTGAKALARFIAWFFAGPGGRAGMGPAR